MFEENKLEKKTIDQERDNKRNNRFSPVSRPDERYKTSLFPSTKRGQQGPSVESSH